MFLLLCHFRRQGYFHETIGDVAKDSYRDTASAQQAQFKASASASFAAGTLDQSQLTHNTHTTSNTQRTKGAKFLQEALVSPKGSVSLSPQKAGRRQSWGPHMSRCVSSPLLITFCSHSCPSTDGAYFFQV